MDLYFSPRPKRLLRLELATHCNYNCTFCCWQNTNNSKFTVHPPTVKVIRLLVTGALRSGCRRIMLTGGEPLLLDERYITELISQITPLDGLDDFWITTNGSLLNSRVSAEFYKAGLRKVVFSIGAANPAAYARYTQQTDTPYSKIWEHVAGAAATGLHVKVDVPISSSGIECLDELFEIIDYAKAAGAHELAYFALHQTIENSHAFPCEYIPVIAFAEALSSADDWQIHTNHRGQTVASDPDGFTVIIPARPEAFSPECRKRQCGFFCQGSYAAYVTGHTGEIRLRACHRRFKSGLNEEVVDLKCVGHRSYIDHLFKRIWAFAYEA